MFRTLERDKQFEVSNIAHKLDLPQEAWKVRPCEWYLEDYKDCTSIKSRFHQYFIFGGNTDCTKWKTDYENCMKFRKNEDINYLEKVIESENERKLQRDESKKQNDVWEYRSESPVNWNSPMPDWMIENKKNSILIDTQNKLNEGIPPSHIFTGFSCTIM